ncbi:MAG: hypothetical protein ACT4NV_15665 [Rhodoferax sp.]
MSASQRVRQALHKLYGVVAPSRPAAAPELERARALVRAIDAGGMPLNPARVNQIARALGLEVSPKAPVEETIERIRAAVARMG